MRYWNVGDSVMRRTLSAEFASLSPLVTFQPGRSGGVEVQLADSPVGLWVEGRREMYTFLCGKSGEPLVQGCDIVSAVEFVRELLEHHGHQPPPDLQMRV